MIHSLTLAPPTQILPGRNELAATDVEGLAPYRPNFHLLGQESELPLQLSSSSPLQDHQRVLLHLQAPSDLQAIQ